MLCEYSCGQEVKFSPKKGLKKWCCSDNWRKCPAKRTYKKFSNTEKIKIKNNYYVIKEIDGLYIDIENIFRGRRILVKCVECGLVREMTLTDYLVCKTNLCKSCCHKGDRNVSKRPDVRAKLSRKGVKDTSYATPEWRQQFSERRKGKGNPNFGKKRSEESKQLTSLTHKKKFLDPIYCLEFGRRFKSKNPNNPEKILQELLKPFDYNYTGNYSFWVDGKNPDFTNKEKKKIVELFGDYWHSEKVTGEEKTEHETQRKKIFEKCGYSCLIIWENELSKISNVIKKIELFNEM
jgi:very-short-patch-repair endonuclease